VGNGQGLKLERLKQEQRKLTTQHEKKDRTQTATNETNKKQLSKKCFLGKLKTT